MAAAPSTPLSPTGAVDTAGPGEEGEGDAEEDGDQHDDPGLHWEQVGEVGGGNDRRFRDVQHAGLALHAELQRRNSELPSGFFIDGGYETGDK